MLRHPIVLPLLSPLLIAGLAAPVWHPISHFAHEHIDPFERLHPGDAPVFDSEGCELCVLTATLVGIEFKGIAVSPSYAIHQGNGLAPHLVYALLPTPTDARAPPVIG